jgi:phenylacetic acid degradation operon negative regulatory protein
MLTLYGDYVHNRGVEIGIGSLIKLLGNFGLSEQSIRSAVSRMCRADLLKVRHRGLRSYYSLTEEGHSLLAKGTQRIFMRKNNQWDRSWSIVIYSVPELRREARDRLRLELSWMGYGPLSNATWISPYDLTKEVEDLAERLQIKEYIQVFQAKHQESTEPKKIVTQCWDLGRIHERYANFIAKYRPKLEYHLKRLQACANVEPSECFVERFNLIHEYRKLPFLDPDLPQELLPENWLRPQAAALFQQYHDLLTEKANEYFDSVCKDYRGARRAQTKGVKGVDERPLTGGNPPSGFPLRTGAKRSADKSR